MKIFSREQIRQADAYTIEQEPVSSIDLMERAALSVVNWIEEKFDSTTPVCIVCGLGNNGGDGLAVARLLKEKGFSIDVFILIHSSSRSDDFTVNHKRYIKIGTATALNTLEEFNQGFSIAPDAILVDAILGSGLNKPVEGFLADCIRYINSLPNIKIAVDVPSGLFCDHLNAKESVVLQANYTLSFQFPKLAFMYPENANKIGEFSLLDIGLSEAYIDQTPTNRYFILKKDVLTFLKQRSSIAHKGNFGHALLYAGSYGKMGAAVLAARACMRSGAGLLTCRVPQCGYDILQTGIPEAMVSVDPESHFLAEHIHTDKYNAICIGPGIGVEKETQNVLKLLIQNASCPLVLDADAINILAENKTWLSFLPSNTILTPHPKEFERIAGSSSNSEERLTKQVEFSIKYGVIVVLKGAHTSISSPQGDVFFNSTGNPGMATAGSGDVLTGIITSLLAQQYKPIQAAILGVYLHGLAGDLAAKKISMEAMIASDIVDNLPDSFLFLME
ncbi:MAG: NAD(P)H-hydrate dehydratase [Bacteroidia bacterium]|nr:NAD(P)H-hydrate dehydratase [Bacteroidia bacterium]